MTESELRSLVREIAPGAGGEELLVLEDLLRDAIAEAGKDVGRFKGSISVFKQRAIDTISGSPKALVTTRGLEKDATKKLNKLVDDLEKSLLYWYRRLKSTGSDKISPTKFRTETKLEIKLAYEDAYRLGTQAAGLTQTGSLVVIGDDERRWLDSMFNQEMKYFNKLLDVLVRRDASSNSKNRLARYANAVRSVFEASRVLQVPDNHLIYWVLQSNNPCSHCRFLHRNSPYTKNTLPTTPKAGSTACLDHCYCKLRVVKAKPSEIAKVERKHKSAKALLAKLRKVGK